MTERSSVTLNVTLTTEQAEAYSQFLKRVGHSDYRRDSVDDAEAYAMMYAGEQFRIALSQAGYSPR